MKHYEERLENDLARAHAAVDDLAMAVLEALRSAMRAVLEGNQEIAYETIIGDHPINRYSRKIDRLCHAFIARHLPGAGHLRLMSSIIRTNVALERIGDYAVTISRESVQMSEPPPARVAKQRQSLSDRALQLLEDSITAFRVGNADTARELKSIPSDLKSDMDQIYGSLIDKAKKRRPQETVAEFVIFSLIKRVSDQARNICDQTVFSAAGEIKSTRHFTILFVDRTNACLSLMAEAIGNKRYEESATFMSAGSEPADEVNPDLARFLDDRGIAADEAAPRAFETLKDQLQSVDIVIRVGDMSGELLKQLPFHTSAFHWEASEPGEADSDEQRMKTLEENYRFLSINIEDLIDTLVGDDAN